MKIPKHYKQVYKGQIYEVYNWPQKMFDGSVKTFEAVKRQDTVIVIATVGNKIVLLTQKQPGTNWFYCTPSGRMDVPGEKPVEAAKRELLEETGMVADKFIPWMKKEKKGHLISTTYFFIARNCKVVTPQKLDGGEKIKVSLISFEEFLKLVDDPKSHLAESMEEMYKAKFDKKYKKYFKKLIFG